MPKDLSKTVSTITKNRQSEVRRYLRKNIHKFGVPKFEFIQSLSTFLLAAFFTQTVNLGTHKIMFEIWDTAGVVLS